MSLDKHLEKMQSKLNKEIIDKYSYNTEITFDSIQKFYWALGFSRTSIFTIIPLTFTQTLTTGFSGSGEGLHAVILEETYTKVNDFKIGDKINAKIKLKEAKTVNSPVYGEAILQTDLTEIYNQNNVLLTKLEAKYLRFERSPKQKFSLNKKKWTKKELANLLKLEEKQKLDLIDINNIPSYTIGPYSIEDFIMWQMATDAGPFIRAFEDRLRIASLKPGLYLKDEQKNPISYANVHWYPKAAKNIGLPKCFDFGRQRIGLVEKSLLRFKDYKLKELNLKSTSYVFVGELLIIDSKLKEQIGNQITLGINCKNENGLEKANGYAILEKSH